MNLVNQNKVNYLKSGMYLLGVLLLIYGIFPCIGTTYDSQLYLDASDKLVAFGFRQEAFAAKPPLYVLILWLLGGNLFFISLLNVACWAMSIILIDRMVVKSGLTGTQEILVAVWIAFSTTLHLVHNFVWTEAIFLVLILGFIHLLFKSQRNYLLLSILALGMVSLKHIGVLFIAGAIFTAFYTRNLSKMDASWIGSAVLFFVGWQVVSSYLNGDLSRLDHLANLSFLSNYEKLGMGITPWFIPFEVPMLVYLLPLLVLGGLIYTFIHYENLPIKTLAISALFMIIMILTKGDLILDDVERYLFFLEPLMLLFFYRIASEFSLTGWIINGSVIWWLAYHVLRTIKNDIWWHEAFC